MIFKFTGRNLHRNGLCRSLLDHSITRSHSSVRRASADALTKHFSVEVKSLPECDLNPRPPGYHTDQYGNLEV